MAGASVACQALVESQCDSQTDGFRMCSFVRTHPCHAAVSGHEQLYERKPTPFYQGRP